MTVLYDSGALALAMKYLFHLPHHACKPGMPLPSAKAEPASKETYTKEQRDYMMMFERTLMLTLTAPRSSSNELALALAGGYAPAMPTWSKSHMLSPYSDAAARMHAAALRIRVKQNQTWALRA